MPERRSRAEPAASAPSWRLRIGLALLLAAITFGLYAPVGGHAFVDYDDPDYVTANDPVLAGLTWSGVRWAFTTGHAGNWHPLTWLSHMLDVEWFGESAGGHHLTSVVLHCLNAVLVLLLFERMTGALWPSAFVAAVFAWHPLHVESVAWVAERKDVLSTFFGLASLWAYVSHARSERPAPGHASVPRGSARARAAYGLSLVLFALGLMCKPMLVTWPFLMLCLDAWPLRRFAAGESRSSARRLVLEKLPFLALALASSVVTFVVQREQGAVSGLAELPLTARAANALVSYARYAGKALWPVDLAAPYHPHPDTGRSGRRGSRPCSWRR